MGLELLQNNMNKKLTFRNKLGYGLGDFAFNLSFQGVIIFMLVFYTDVLGIEGKTAGLILLIASIWDAISDPIMGFFANRTRSKWGKYRPYLLWVAIPLGISFIALFYKPNLSITGIIIYALITQILFRTFFTIGNIPYSSLATEMSQNEAERSDLAGFRMFLGMLGALIVGKFSLQLIEHFSEGREIADGYFTVAILSATLAAIVFFLSFYYTKEQTSTGAEGKPPSFSLKEVGQMMRQNWPFWLLFAFMLIGMTTVTILAPALNYYYNYKFSDAGAFGNAMLCLQGAMTLSIVLWTIIAQKTSKRNTLLIGASLAIIGGLAFYFNSAPSPLYINICLILIGSAVGAGAICFWSMLPDTVEFGEWKSGIRAEAFIAALGLFPIKLSVGLGAWMLGLMLSSVGYDPSAAQTQEVLNGLHHMAALTPALGFFCIACIMWFYPIDAKYHKDLLEKLKTQKKVVN